VRAGGGFFFAFSTTVMKALARLPAAQGVAAMQSVNLVVINPLVMLALFGTGLACVVLVIAAFIEWGEPYAVYLLVGGLLYVVGVVLLTGRYHVPRNNALAALDPNDPDAERQWNRYVRTWTAGNHVRTIAPLASAALLTIALRVS
jgi:uncharacterized membrane protein